MDGYRKHLAVFVCVVLAGSVFANAELLYRFEVAAFGVTPTPPTTSLDPQMREILWVANGGRGRITKIKTVPWSLLRGELGARNTVADDSARRLLQSRKGGWGPWHLQLWAAETWITRNWTSDQTIQDLADKKDFGNGVRGFADASSYFFGVQLSDLSIGRLATLAELSRFPSYYDPFCEPEALIRGRDRLLIQLVDSDVVDEEERFVVGEPLEVSAKECN